MEFLVDDDNGRVTVFFLPGSEPTRQIRQPTRDEEVRLRREIEMRAQPRWGGQS